MNYLNSIPRATHVNAGTSIPAEKLTPEYSNQPMMRHPKLQVSASGPSTMTAYGGLALATRLTKKLGVAKALDARLDLLKVHRPYHESDHVLAHTYNLFVGGTCIEDMANLQQSEAVLRMLGTTRFPDPTTGGDFLRRFDGSDLRQLDAAVDEVQERAWRRIAGRKKRDVALVDLDSHVRPVYGHQKEGADFSYKGSWAYHPLVISLAGTNECLRLINRPGNVQSQDGSAEALDDLFPMLKRHFHRVIVRGDSAFYDKSIVAMCEAHEQSFAFVVRNYPNLVKLADQIPMGAWQPFRARPQRARTAAPTPPNKRRRRRANLRRKKALERKKRDLLLKEQWVAEIAYKPSRCEGTYRLIIRRQRIEENDKQGQLFDLWRYRFAITNLPIEGHSAEEVLDLTYHRCDQENLIEQLGNGIAGMRMPTGDFLANAAFLCCARLAHNLKSWLGQMVLPAETVRWEWKRFRLAFVYFAVQVVRHARQLLVRLSPAHRHHATLVQAYVRLEM